MSTQDFASIRTRVTAHSTRVGLKVRASNLAYGLAMNALFHPGFSVVRMRRNFDLFAATSLEKMRRKFPKTTFESKQIGALAAESICAVSNPTRAILYLHGGGYVFGSIATYRRRAVKLSYRCRALVLLPEYRLAPEHAYPAALEDALSAWRSMVALHPDCSHFVAGDSAGGGLALSLVALLRDEGAALPKGVVALSPWTDLTLSGASIERNHETDCWMKMEQLQAWRNHYRGSHDASHPLISPLFADFAGFPPLLTLVGDQELLLDDTLRLLRKAQDAGVSVRSIIGRGMQHDWPLTLPWLEQSSTAWHSITQFIETVDR